MAGGGAGGAAEPVQAWELIGVEDAPNETVDIAVWPKTPVQLGGKILANLAAAAPLVFQVADPTALGVAGFFITELLVRPITITTLTVNPTLSLGQNSPTWNDIIAGTAIASAVGQVFHLRPPPAATLPYVPAGQVASLAIVPATAVLYLAEIIVHGKIQRT